MTDAQKYLLGNNLADIVLNAKEYPENTPENAKKWIYLSDVLKQYAGASENNSPLPNITTRSCPNCGHENTKRRKALMNTHVDIVKDNRTQIGDNGLGMNSSDKNAQEIIK